MITFVINLYYFTLYIVKVSGEESKIKWGSSFVSGSDWGTSYIIS